MRKQVVEHKGNIWTESDKCNTFCKAKDWRAKSGREIFENLTLHESWIFVFEARMNFFSCLSLSYRISGVSILDKNLLLPFGKGNFIFEGYSASQKNYPLFSSTFNKTLENSLNTLWGLCRSFALSSLDLQENLSVTLPVSSRWIFVTRSDTFVYEFLERAA